MQFVDTSISTRQAEDFNQALNYVSNFAKSHHFDDSVSSAAHLSNQMGADLRDAETASANYDASLSQSQRISQAQHYVESHSAQINTDLNQTFPAFVASRVGESARDQLFASPGNPAALQQLESLGQAFVAHKRDSLMADFGATNQTGQIDSFYQHNSTNVIAKGANVGSTYQTSHDGIVKQAHEKSVGINKAQAQQLTQSASHFIQETHGSVNEGGARIEEIRHESMAAAQNAIDKGKHNAQRGVVIHPIKQD